MPPNHPPARRALLLRGASVPAAPAAPAWPPPARAQPALRPPPRQPEGPSPPGALRGLGPGRGEPGWRGCGGDHVGAAQQQRTASGGGGRRPRGLP